jgi:hypothetical protein
MRPSPLLASLFLFAACSAALADSLWTKSGERFVGEVTEEGDNYRVKTALVPEGVLVPKSSVTARFPAPDVMLREVDIEIEEARRLSEGVVTGVGDVTDLVNLVNARLEWCDERIRKLQEAYPGEGAECAKLTKRIEQVRAATTSAYNQLKGVSPEKAVVRVTPVAEAPGTPVPPTVLEVPATQYLLSPPAPTTAEATAAAAKVMQKRLTAYGYRGVEVAVIETPGGPKIKFTSRDGLTREVCERIRWFGTYPGRSFEGRIESRPAPAAMALIDRPRPDRLDDVKCPLGARWYLFHSSAVILLQDDPVMRGEDFRKPIVDSLDSTITFALAPATCHAIREALPLPNGVHDTNQFALVLDGHAFRLRGTRLAYETDGRVWVKDPPKVIAGQGGGYKGGGHWEAKKGTQVWVRTGMLEASWKPIRIALDLPMDIRLEAEK